LFHPQCCGEEPPPNDLSCVALAKGKIPSHLHEWVHVAHDAAKKGCQGAYGENHFNKNEQSTFKYICAAAFQHTDEWGIQEWDRGKEWWKAHVPWFARRGETPE
jgi:hypothetical protein